MYEPRHIPASHRLSAWLLSALFALSLCLQQAWAAPAERTVIPLGQAVGIKLFADGVLVVALADGPTPAHACGLRQGDIITAMDGAAVGSTEQVQDLLADTAGAPIVLSVRRGADALALTACARENNGVWQLGAWIRDSMAGIGTLTYYDPATGQYGALGHGIADVDTAQLMPLASGAIMETTVKAVKKGAKGDPGELKGDFSVQRDVGTVTVNSSGGIFGTVADPDFLSGGTPVPVAAAGQITTGPATILATVSGSDVREYRVELVRLYGADEPTRNLLLRITDPALLSATGGIVQGMSGSPILQNGRIVGAVTHVLLNDPTADSDGAVNCTMAVTDFARYFTGRAIALRPKPRNTEANRPRRVSCDFVYSAEDDCWYLAQKGQRQLLPAEFSGWAACSPHDGVAHATTAHRTFRRMERTRTGGFRFPPEQTDAGGRCSVYIVDQTGTMQFAEVRLPAPPPPTLPLSEANQSTEPSVS